MAAHYGSLDKAGPLLDDQDIESAPDTPVAARKHGSINSDASSGSTGSLDMRSSGTPNEGIDDDVKDDISEDLESNTSTGHCHMKDDLPKLDKRARNKLLIASGLCLVFMVAEIVGGVLANSLAIATDAAHLLTDFASFMISLFSVYMAARPATKKMSFGWHRAEVVGALVSVLMIWVITGVLVSMAIQRVRNQDYVIDPVVMLITSGLGLVFNVIILVSLHDHGHGHSHGGGHGHSHGHNNNNTNKKSSRDNSVDNGDVKKAPDSLELKSPESNGNGNGNGHSQQNINVRAAFIHAVGDLVQSAGVFTASLIIYFKPEYKIADPICTFLFSVLVLVTTLGILKDTFVVLMEGTPRGVQFVEVRRMLKEISGVRDLHNLRLWSLTMNRIAVSVHLAVEDGADNQLISQKASQLLREEFGVGEITVQTEPYVEDMKDCEQCQGPPE